MLRRFLKKNSFVGTDLDYLHPETVPMLANGDHGYKENSYNTKVLPILKVLDYNKKEKRNINMVWRLGGSDALSVNFVEVIHWKEK